MIADTPLVATTSLSSANTPSPAPQNRQSRKAFARWCVANLHLLADLDLYMEDPRCTIGQWTSWVHLQIFAPRSGQRVFIPTADWAARLKGDPLTPEDIKA